jgi:hypothetical protein
MRARYLPSSKFLVTLNKCTEIKLPKFIGKSYILK